MERCVKVLLLPPYPLQVFKLERKWLYPLEAQLSDILFFSLQILFVANKLLFRQQSIFQSIFQTINYFCRQQISKQKLLISGKSTLRYILRRTIRGPGAKTRQLRFGLERKHVNYVFAKYCSDWSKNHTEDRF